MEHLPATLTTEEMNAELAPQGLRLASDTESGWYALLSNSKRVWSTTLEEPESK